MTTEHLAEKAKKLKCVRTLNRFNMVESPAYFFDDPEEVRYEKNRIAGTVSGVDVVVCSGDEAVELRARSQEELDIAYRIYLNIFTGLR